MPCVPCLDPATGEHRLECAANLYDPSPVLPFRELIPERCVPDRVPREWLPVLRDAGMATRCDRETFLGLALQVAV